MYSNWLLNLLKNFNKILVLLNDYLDTARFEDIDYWRGNYDIDESELGYPVGQEDIHFIPAISGAGKGFGKILLGAALIGAAFFVPVK